MEIDNLDSNSAPAGEVESPANSKSDGVTSANKDKDGIQARIDKLVREKYEKEREAAYWKGVADSKSADPAPTTKKKELNPDDFNSDSEYLKAVAEETKKELRDEIILERSKEVEEKKKREITSQYEKGRKDHPDFDSVALNTSIPITQVMFDSALGENLSDILYHLGKNPIEASRISSLSVTQQIKEIGKIEVLLSSKPSPKTKTNAADPITTVKGARSSSSKDQNKMTRAELHTQWEAARRKRMTGA